MKKCVIILLALILVLTPIIGASCDTDDISSGEELNSSDNASNTKSDLSDMLNEDIFPYANIKFNNETVTIFTVDTARNIYGELQFVPSEETEGSVINEAVKARNQYIYENYGVDIKIISENYPARELYNIMQTKEVNFDIVCAAVDNMLLRCLDSCFIKLDDILNLDDPWWDQRANDMLSPDGIKHYFAAGEAILLDSEFIYMTMYNKKLYNENLEIQEKYGDIYDIVKNGNFTYDTFAEISKLASVPDNEGNMSISATFGNISSGLGGTIFFNGSGVGLAEKDAKGELRVTVLDQKSIDVFDKVFNLITDSNITLRAEQLKTTSDPWGHAGMEKTFNEGRGLFFLASVSLISAAKQREEELGFNFGILPIPKYTQEQENYYCAVDRYHSGVIGIPSITASQNMDLIGFTLNALGYYNTHGNGDKSVMDAYYEVTLKTQGTDEKNDEDMLDLIFKSKMYDLGSIYSWNNAALIYMVTNVITSGNNTLVSKYEAVKNAVESEMHETIKILSELEY